MASDSVRITNMPDSGSPANVAFKLMDRIADAEPSPTGDEARQYLLDLYAECLYAANGHRDRPKK